MSFYLYIAALVAPFWPLAEFIHLPYGLNLFNALYVPFIIYFFIYQLIKGQFKGGKLLLPMIGFLMLSLLSGLRTYFFSAYPEKDIYLISHNFLKPILYFSLYSVGLNYVLKIRKVVSLVACGLFLLIASILFSYLFGIGGHVLGSGASGFYNEPFGAALMYGLYLPVIYFTMKTEKGKVRVSYVLILLAGFSQLVLMGNRSSYVGLILATIFFLTVRRKVNWPALGLVMLIVGSIFLLQTKYLQERLDFFPIKTESDMDKFSHGRITNIRYYYDAVTSDVNTIFFGKGYNLIRWKAKKVLSSPACQNTPLDIVAELGLLGLFMICWFILRILKLLLVGRVSHDFETTSVSYAMLYSLIFLVFFAQTVPIKINTGYFCWFWLLLGIVERNSQCSFCENSNVHSRNTSNKYGDLSFR